MTGEDYDDGMTIVEDRAGPAVWLAARVDGERIASAVTDGVDLGGGLMRWRWCVDHPRAARLLTEHDAPTRIEGPDDYDGARYTLRTMAYAVMTAVAAARLIDDGAPTQMAAELGAGSALLMRITARAAQGGHL